MVSTCARFVTGVALVGIASSFPPNALFAQGQNVTSDSKPKQAVTLSLTSAECRKNNIAESCQLGDTLYVSFGNLHEWMSDADKNKPEDLELVLNDRVMKGVRARGPDTEYKELEFDLKPVDHDQDNRDSWSTLLSRLSGTTTLNVGVALSGATPYSNSKATPFEVYPWYTRYVCILLVLLLISFLILAKFTDILRDAPTPTGTKTKLSFSLARTQMAWWFFIVVASYLYIWMVIGDSNCLTPGALILIGISGSTALGGYVIDSTKRDQRNSLQSEKSDLTAKLASLATSIAVIPPPANLDDLKQEQLQKTARLKVVTDTLDSLPSPPEASQGFIPDILRDETGVSLHRFQMAIWTVVLGLVFVVAVCHNLTMPDFSTTLLSLMGISSGIYIGFKIPDPPK